MQDITLNPARIITWLKTLIKPTRLAAMLGSFLLMSSCSQHHYPESDHSDGSRFYNQDRQAAIDKGLWDVIKWKLTGEQQPWPEFVHDNAKPNFNPPLKHGVAAVTFINHATDFIQFSQLNVLSDPVFSERVSPVSWFGPKRHRAPGATLAELPPINVVVISHNHFDHMDIPSLVAIENKDHPTFIVPLGNKALLQKNGIHDVIELDWWQSHTTQDGAIITLVPMQHWSTRGLFDRFETLWGGYVIQASGLQVLFAGDTGYNRQFKDIADKFGPMDMSLLPIGAFAPRWFMHEQHIDPQEAVQAHLDLQSKLSIAMHFGTFQLADEGFEQAANELSQSLLDKQLDGDEFIVPRHGQTIVFGQSPIHEMK